MPEQNSSYPDGSFKSTPVQNSPTFGVETGQNPGTTPGAAQAKVQDFGGRCDSE